MRLNRISPCLWFDSKAEEAARYYCSIFENSKIRAISRWLKDRYGLSWQVVPTVLAKLMTDPDTRRADRVMTALLQMKKFDIAALRRASEG